MGGGGVVVLWPNIGVVASPFCILYSVLWACIS